LHAVLVMLTRHFLELSENRTANNFSVDLPGLDQIIDYIHQRVKHIDPDEVASTMEQLNARIEEWAIRAEEDQSLRYDSKQQPQFPSLLRTAGYTRTEGWDTLHSMRNIDKSCVIKIINM